MKRKNILYYAAAFISCTAIFCSCALPSEVPAASETTAVTEAEDISSVTFKNGASGLFECADGWCNGCSYFFKLHTSSVLSEII